MQKIGKFCPCRRKKAVNGNYAEEVQILALLEKDINQLLENAQRTKANHV